MPGKQVSSSEGSLAVENEGESREGVDRKAAR